MRDGQTKKLQGRTRPADFRDFAERYRVRIVLVSGTGAGQEIVLDRERLTLGRGPGVDVAFRDAAMSRQHAAIEYAAGGIRIRDLGSTNGLAVNGTPVQVKELAHGDRFRLGGLQFQLVVEEAVAVPEAYELPGES